MQTMCGLSTIIPWLGIMLCYCHMLCAGELAENTGSSLESTRSEAHLVHNTSSASKTALLAIFTKYGRNGSLSFEGFEHLLGSLGLGNIVVPEHNVSEHADDKGTWSVTLATDDRHSLSEHHHHHDDELHVEDNEKKHQERASNSSAVCAHCLSSVVSSRFVFTSAVVTGK